MVKKAKKTKSSSKKTKSSSKKIKSSSKKTKSSSKKKRSNPDELDIVFVDEDISIDKESELEARKAYLEEARSQDASGD